MPASAAAPNVPATARAHPPATSRIAASLKSTDKLLVWLVFLLICVSIVATLPQTVAKLRYISLAVPGGELGFRWLREAMFMVVMIVTGVVVAAGRRGIPRGATAALFLVSLWVVVAAYWSVVLRDVPAFMALLGVRLIQYAPLVLVGYLLTRSAGYASLRLFARLLRWYVAFQGAVALFQVLGGTRLNWARTIFGYRAFGTHVSYNQFGATLAVCALVFCVASLWGRQFGERTRFDRWMLFASLIAATSASRTALVLCLFVVAYYTFATFRVDVALKRAVVVLVPLVAVAFYYIANEPLITGRTTSVAIQEEKRVDIWGRGMRAFETPGEVLFGVGLGQGASGAWMSDQSAVGRMASAGQRSVTSNPHSAYISLAASFGLVGVLGYLGALGMTWARAPRRVAAVFVITVVGLGIPLGFMQVFPANALVFFVWGSILGAKGLGRSRAAAG